MSHQYCRKFKNNRNATPVIVGRQVFYSLVAAEDYCTAQGLDPNIHIEWEDTQEFKNQAIEMAKQNIAALKMVRSALNTRKEQLVKKKQMASQEWEQAKANNDLLTEHYHGRLNEAIAEFSENCESSQLVFRLLEELYKITGWHE